MKFQNIVWDWNGTIVNDAWIFVDVMNKILKHNNLPVITLSEYRNNFCFPIQSYWKSLGFQFTPEKFNQLNTHFISEYQKKIFLPKLHRGIFTFLNNFNKQGLQQFILSASENTLLQQSVHFYKLNFLFKNVLGVNNLNATGKKELGHLLFKQYNLKPHITLIVGDTEYDYDVAKFLNCSVVLISHGHINHQRLLKTGAIVVKSLRELKTFLQKN